MKPNISMIIGGVLVIAAIAICIHSLQFLSSAVSSKGRVIRLSESCGSKGCTYSPEVSFIAKDGSEYRFWGARTNPPSGQVGQDVEVVYNPTQPKVAKINDFMNFWFLPLIIFVFGAVLFAIGIWINAAFRRDIPKNLAENGQVIQAIVQQVGLDDIRINGRSPYRIIAQWIRPGSNEAYIFKSSDIWLDPQAYVKPGDNINVTIDPNNPKKYFVDISFLPIVKNG